MYTYIYNHNYIFIYAFITNNFQGNPSSRFIPSFVGADKSEPQLRGMPPGCHWTRVFFPRRNGGFLAVILRIYIYDVKNKYIYIYDVIYIYILVNENNSTMLNIFH